MTHGKGIAGGYISRIYDAPSDLTVRLRRRSRAGDVRVNGAPSRCEPAAIHQLASMAIAMLVWHLPWDQTRDNSPGLFAERDAAAFVGAAFAGRSADVSDDTIKAWRIPAPDAALPSTPVVELTSGWYPVEATWRWAQSPAGLRITSAQRMNAELVIEMVLVHGLETPVGLGQEGVLIVTTGGEPISVAVKPGEAVRVPIVLDERRHGRDPDAGRRQLPAGRLRPG